MNRSLGWLLLRLAAGNLDQVGSGNASALSCKQARTLIDRFEPLTTDERTALDYHNEQCGSCCAAERIEYALRECIAPSAHYLPSAGFEARLMAQIGIVPEAVRADDALSKWGRVFGISTIAVIVGGQYKTLWEMLKGLRNPLLSFYAYLLSFVKGESAEYAFQFLNLHIDHSTLLVSGSLMLGLLLIGGVAYRHSLSWLE